MTDMILGYLFGTIQPNLDGSKERVSKGLLTSKTTQGAIVFALAWLSQHFGWGWQESGLQQAVQGAGMALGPILSAWGIRSAVSPMGPRVVMPLAPVKAKRKRAAKVGLAGVGLNGVQATVVSQRKPRATKEQMAARRAQEGEKFTDVEKYRIAEASKGAPRVDSGSQAHAPV